MPKQWDDTEVAVMLGVLLDLQMYAAIAGKRQRNARGRIYLHSDKGREGVLNTDIMQQIALLLLLYGWTSDRRVLTEHENEKPPITCNEET